jgi:RNA polymerase sigma-70 factor (ECF subfamily)
VRRVELLRLRFEDDQPIRDIAARWGLEAAHVHHEYARARREFREVLVEIVAEQDPRSAPEEECARLLGLLAEGRSDDARK